MTHSIITSTEANRSFSDILNQVYYQGKTFDIKRGKDIIATLTPAAPIEEKVMTAVKLNKLFQTLPQLHAEDYKVFESDLKTVRASTQIESSSWD